MEPTTTGVATPPERFRLSLSKAGKVRNRAEAHLIQYTQKLLAEPVPYTIEAIHLDLLLELDKVKEEHPSWGTCRVSGINVASRIMGKPHLVTRNLAIYGRGRGIFSLLVSETITKDASNNYAPRI